MEQNTTLDDPARAFDDLRREVSLGLRAIQGLAAEHREQPDYSDTLQAIDTRLIAFGKTLSAIASSPAMRLTPGNLTQEIVQAGKAARQGDAETLRTAGATADQLIHQLRLGIEQVRVAKAQRIAVYWAIAAGMAIGILFWAIVPGAFMRALQADGEAPRSTATQAVQMDTPPSARHLVAVRQLPSPRRPTQSASDKHRPDRSR